jgi:hypothetical protein
MPPAVVIPTAELQDLKGGNKTYALIAILVGKEFDRQSRYVPIQYLFGHQICVYIGMPIFMAFVKRMQHGGWYLSSQLVLLAWLMLLERRLPSQ